MLLLWRYIKGKKNVFLCAMLSCAVFAVVFSFYHLPFKAVAYPSLLCLLLWAIFVIVSFIKAVRRHNELKHIAALTSGMIDDLPACRKIEDYDYQAIIRALQDEVRHLETADAEKYRNTVEYYTIWAHQIKTPIASMRLTLQNEDTDLSRRLQFDLLRIEQYAEMVLAFLRLDSVSSDYVFKEYQLDSIIRQAVKKFSNEFIGRKIALEYSPVNKITVTDEKWLLFVLEQIISNALKYTRNGKISIYMTGQSRLCIRDTGIGIAPEDLPRIFENGFTGYNGRSDKKASGIGLYLCKRVCNNLNISIKATSELGSGTVIELDLEQKNYRKE